MKSGPALICQDERRRDVVRKSKKWNGLDYLEVGPDQLTLTVFFLGKAPEDLKPENVIVEPCGGGRPVRVTGIRLCRVDDPERDDCLHVSVDRPGGFSPYRLCLVEVATEGDDCGRMIGKKTGKPFHGFDSRYSCLEFSFKAGCPSDLDCKEERICPPEPRQEPPINYLAKDYAGFRQLMLDRLALTMPDWKERHVPDLGIALVEVLAYTGDYLSYYQDAVGTEAYLDTARRRISVRRHVRLVDYPMHEGCNARAWVFVETDTDLSLRPADFYCITHFDTAPPVGKPLTEDDLLNVSADQYLVFEPVAGDPARPVELRKACNEIRFYTWDDAECCLPRGATRATLRDEWLEPSPSAPPPVPAPPFADGKAAYGHEPPPPPPEHCPPPRKRRLDLTPGDLLLFEEVLGPKTGNPADADPGHRHVVRLLRVEPSVDELHDQPILEIEWALEDALPFPLCLSAVGGKDCKLLDPVSVARGNVFLVDHGRRVPEDLGSVPPAKTEVRCEGEGRVTEVPQIPGRFNPPLKSAPLTFRQPLPPHPERVAAARLLAQDPRKASPAVTLTSVPAFFDGAAWSARGDLLESGPDDLHFVAEVDDDGRAHLRFGNGDLGLAPPAGTAFQAVYRVGNGRAGNVGAEAVRHLVLRNPPHSGAILRPRNPLPARGGTDPEPLADVRLLAPHAFRQELRRAVVAEDYARLVERDFAGRVQRAAATLRWTGSWTEVLVAVDPLSSEGDVPRLLREIGQALQRYRRIGHDVVVKRAVAVPLDVELSVCVLPHYLRGHVEAALLDALGNRALPDGRRGLFHPDNLTFGQGIALSRLVAAAQAVTGVERVEVTRLERLYEGPNGEIVAGFLPIGPLEIARLDNDPRFPGNGQLRLTMGGGR
jgi:hypothetical protein